MASISTIFLTFYNFLMRSHFSRNPTHAKPFDHTSLSSTLPTTIFDLEGTLLRSSSTFPYFMVVAMEAGSPLRAMLLLLLYPIVCCMSEGSSVKLMAFVSFFGIRREGFRAGRAVLPKHLMEALGAEGFEVAMRGRKRVCASVMPLEMVEGFLKGYMNVDVVVGRRMKVVCGYYTGLMDEEEDEEVADLDLGDGVIGFGSSFGLHLHPIFASCEEVYMVSKDEKKRWHPLPKCKLPTPLVFHDGRLAFTPTAAATLAMFLWFPLGFALALLRTSAFLVLPYDISRPILAFSGMYIRIVGSVGIGSSGDGGRRKIYVCNHRTLLDPLYISAMLAKNTTAVIYGLSHLAEVLSPVRTLRLTRHRDVDRRRMAMQLQEGDLVVCPEGTTCREPFLLRFSPLFAELGADVRPVALASWVGTFHGTTAGGHKWLDPLFFLMNPAPIYRVAFLEELPEAETPSTSRDQVANMVQGAIGSALGYECTSFTRKDKYSLLAGNDGFFVRG